ncbi:MAG: glutamine amidotransferase [Armatimonadota bacterium]
MRTAMMLLFAAVPLAAMAQTEHQLTIDDFEQDTLGQWQTSVSPEYYRGGEGREGLAIVEDPEQGRVMQARIAFVDPNASEPVWITRFLEEPISLRHVVGGRVRYKITGVDQAPIDSLKLRLRTSPSAFSDYELLPEEGVALDRWQVATVSVRENMPMRNIYNAIFGEIQQVTLRLDDIDERNSEFLLLVDEIALFVEEAPQPEWSPTQHQLRPNDRLDVLLITHSTAGFYNIEEAARALDPDARVDRYLFRGLHFPLWGFPEGVEALLDYDAIVMIDVDPWVLSQQQADWLGSLVHSGVGLVFLGGPETLTHAQDFKLPLREALPITFEAGAEDITAAATPQAADHPLTRGLPGERLGTVVHVHDVVPREGAEVAFTASDRPLVVTGAFGAGRVALVNAWTEFGSTMRDRFLGTDLADDLVRALLGWAADALPEARLQSVELPEPSIVAPATVTVRAEGSEQVSGLRLRIGDQEPQTSEGAGPASFEIELQPSPESERSIPCVLEALDVEGSVSDRRDFEIEVLNPLGLDIAWAAHQRTFEPGAALELTARLTRRDLPGVEASGSSLNMSFASGRLPVAAAGLADIWVVPSGSEETLHDLSGPTDVETVTSHEDLRPTVTTTGITRADREDMDFGDDPRIQRVSRTASVQPDGSVRLDYHYEFLQDVQVDRISTMLTLPASVYAGMPFTAQQQEGTTEGALPREPGSRQFDGHGLDLTIDTPHGPLRIQVPDESLRVWMQDLRRYDMGSFRIEIEAPFEDSLAREGDSYDVPIIVTGPEVTGGGQTPDLDALAIQCELIDGNGRSALQWAARRAETQMTFARELPDLRSGEYELRVAVRSGDEELVRTAEQCWVVDPLRREDFFPIMSIMGIGRGAHLMDPSMIRARIDDLHAHGFNAAAGANARSLSRPASSPPTELDVYAQGYAQRLGMAPFYEYHSLTLVRRQGQVPVSVFDPEHKQRLREMVEPQFEVCDRTARLLSIKILDEPHVGPDQLLWTERCREVFRERYGADYVPVEELGDDAAARWRLADFLGYYVERAYGLTREIREEHGGEWDLLLTFNSPGLGYGRGYTSRQDILSWGRQAGRMDFDIYPYFYPASQKVRMVQADYGLSMMRSFAQHIERPWGFYVELDDRNWPYQKNPKEASAECAFTAVAQGANYLNSFIHRGFGTGVSSRPQRWEETGRAMRAIRRVGPLLTRMQRPRATAAVIYPMAQAMIYNGHSPEYYTLTCLRHGFGMTDAVSSEILAEDATQFERDAFVLLNCEILERPVAERLVEFVRGGGTVIIDHDPAVDIQGEPLGLPWHFDGLEAQALPGLPDCPRRTLADGEGRVILLDFDIEEAYREATEEDMFERAAALRTAVRTMLSGATSLCIADDEHGQMEAGLRLGEDAALVTVVNHWPEENAAELRLRDLPFEVGWLCDLTTMEPVEFRAGPDAHSCDVVVRLAGRHSQMLAVLPERPAELAVDVAEAELRPGGQPGARAEPRGAACVRTAPAGDRGHRS